MLTAHKVSIVDSRSSAWEPVLREDIAMSDTGLWLDVFPSAGKTVRQRDSMSQVFVFLSLRTFAAIHSEAKTRVISLGNGSPLCACTTRPIHWSQMD